jgi:hypothetical protein
MPYIYYRVKYKKSSYVVREILRDIAELKLKLSVMRKDLYFR